MQLTRAGEPRNGSGKLFIRSLSLFQLAKDARQALRQGIVLSLTIGSRESLADDHQCKVGGWLVHMGETNVVRDDDGNVSDKAIARRKVISWLGPMIGRRVGFSVAVSHDADRPGDLAQDTHPVRRTIGSRPPPHQSGLSARGGKVLV